MLGGRTWLAVADDHWSEKNKWVWFIFSGCLTDDFAQPPRPLSMSQQPEAVQQPRKDAQSCVSSPLLVADRAPDVQLLITSQTH